MPDKLRGTYAGLASPVVIEYLQSLEITAVELMPVHHFISDKYLEDRGLVNYWGYNTIGFFAPHGTYSHSGDHGQQVTEFKTMVKTFHNEGIEVILDVVYNHSAEGNQMGLLLLSQGVPMIQGGDELGRTSQGNNNTYCQDNELSWIDWDLDRDKKDMLEFTRFVIGLTKRHPVLRRRKFFQGPSIRGSELKDLTWLKPEGQEMTDEDWSNPFARCIGLRLVGEAMDELDAKGRFVRDGTLLLLINAHYEKIPFVLPIDEPDAAWGLILDTREPTGKRLRYQPAPAGERYELEERSLALFYLSRME